jgi:hypothetical protein
MHLLQSCQCIHSTSHNIARRTPLFLSPATLPIIHGPAAAARPASFYTTIASTLKRNFTKRTHLQICKMLYDNHLRCFWIFALQKANPFRSETAFGYPVQPNQG